MSRVGLTELVIRWLMLALAVWVAAQLVPGIYLDGWESTLMVAGILALLNVFLKPVLVLLSLPLTILTFGLFVIVINALLLLLADLIAGAFDVRFAVDDFWAALLGAFMISIVSIILGWFISPRQIARDLTGGW
jgi:putative membrane protein